MPSTIPADRLAALLKRKQVADLATLARAVPGRSLPTADRRIVRSEAMDRRIDRAARSRAPKTKRRAG